jgi:L-2-hydroxyglutarate oxidase LhgO
VVGLAVGRALAQAGREVIVLEAESRPGSGISSRNSEVIHAGIYYAPGSLKAHLCRRGRELLYDYLRASGIPHEPCGKLIVATDADEIATLERLLSTSLANGVDDLRWLSRGEACCLEPELACVAALLSPSTGILDSHAFMLSLETDAVAYGAALALNTRVRRGWAENDRIVLEMAEKDQGRLACRFLVNAAGLGATALARAIAGVPAASIPTLHLAKGSYFALSGRAPFSRLVYPVPEQAGLGVHFTRDLAGRGRFGPNVEWVDAIDYDVDASQANGFEAAIRRYWPAIRAGALHPDYAGVRPKLHGPGEPAADFVIQGPAIHGIHGLVNLFGIESPGLTASLAIAERVVTLLDLR